MDIVTTYIDHFLGTRGRFRLQLPNETPYERMVREFEAGKPEMLETMRLVLPRGSTASNELTLWKEYAATERAKLRESVSVRHTVNVEDSGSLRRSTQWPDRIGENFVRFYQHIHSAELYVDEGDSEGGLRFYPVSVMSDELEGVRCWLEDDPEGYVESESEGKLELLGMPPWLGDTIVFGGVGQSAERFLLACDGPYRGSVLAFDHDPPGMRIAANSFELFLSRIIEEPLSVARWIGLYKPVAYEHRT